MKRGMWAGKIFLGVIIGVLFLYVFILGTQYLWNWLVPVLFSGPVLSFWQTAGILVLTKIIFWPIGKCRCHNSHHGSPWKYYWKNKWSKMTPEEQERIKQKMKDKWCYSDPVTSESSQGTSNV